MHQLYQAVDNTKPIIVVFIDLQKAFDTVNHGLLFSKLHEHGILGNQRQVVYQQY